MPLLGSSLMLTTSNQSIIPSGRKKLMMKSVLILDEFFAMTAKIRTLFLSHIKITNYLTLKHGTFKLRRKNLKKKIIEVAERVLPARLHYWENEKHLKAKGVNVRNLRKRTLGQCSANNYITLSPKILLMPEKLMDSVILHEMAHLVHHHHRKAFWQFLSVLLGEYMLNVLKVIAFSICYPFRKLRRCI